MDVNGDDVASVFDITIDKDREQTFSDIDKEVADEKVEEIEEEHDHKNEKILDVSIELEQLDDGLWEKSQEEIFSTLYREYTQPLDFTSIRKVGLFKHFFLWFLVLVK